MKQIVQAEMNQNNEQEPIYSRNYMPVSRQVWNFSTEMEQKMQPDDDVVCKKCPTTRSGASLWCPLRITTHHGVGWDGKNS